MPMKKNPLLFFWIALQLAFFPVSNVAQPMPPIRLTDTQIANPGSNVSKFVEFNGEVYFSASDENGPGMWKTDGTPGGTMKVLDGIYPADTLYAGSPYVLFKDGLYFAAQSGIVKMTGMVGEYEIISTHVPQHYQMAVMGDYLYYIPYPVYVGENTYQMELWKTDGSVAGTERVAFTSYYDEFGAAPSGGNIAVFNNHLFFQFGVATDFELWRSDGTSQGTALLKDINLTGSSYPANFIEYAGKLYFSAYEPGSGVELWVTDGSADGTQLFADLRPGADYSGLDNLTYFNNRLYFTAYDSAGHPRLWQSDGTVVGTVMLAVINGATPFHQDTTLLRAAGDRLFFFAESTTQWALWVTDGTPGGTQWLHDCQVNVDNFQLRSDNLAVLNGHLYFPDNFKAGNHDGTGTWYYHPTELWRSDGTPGGTKLVKQVLPYHMIAYGDLLLFAGNDLYNRIELWRSDGSPDGTGMVKNLYNLINTEYPQIVVPAATRLYFVPKEQRSAPPLYRIWLSDGSPEGTTPIAGYGVCPNVGVLFEPMRSPLLATIGDILFYPGMNCALWRTDGTTEGTWQVPTGLVSVYEEPATGLTRLGNQLLFLIDPDFSGLQLWATDGSQDPAGSEKLKQISIACDRAYLPEKPVVMNGAVYFFTIPNNTGCEGTTWWKLWKSDGTPDGTQVIAQYDQTSWMFIPRQLVVAGNRLFFLADQPQVGYVLWESDGTPAGTQPVDGVDRTSITGMVSGGDVVYLFDQKYDWLPDDTWLWSPRLLQSKGKQAGGVESVHAFEPFVTPAYTYLNAPELLHAGDGLYFTYREDGSAGKLWRSDGTSAGTHPILTDNGQPVIAFRLAWMGGRLFFAGGVDDMEFWTSNGTPSGTYQVANLDERPMYSSYPALFSWANGRVFFFARDGVYGTELWAYELNHFLLHLPFLQR